METTYAIKDREHFCTYGISNVYLGIHLLLGHSDYQATYDLVLV